MKPLKLKYAKISWFQLKIATFNQKGVFLLEIEQKWVLKPV